MKYGYLLTTMAWAIVLAAFPPGGALGEDAKTPVPQAEAAGGAFITLQVPVLSPLFAETPVALVNDEPLTLGELTRELASLHAGASEGAEAGGRDLEELLQRLVATRLIIQEARNIGLDELPEIKAQLEDFAEKSLLEEVMQRHLKDVKPDPGEVDELYRQLSREFLLETLTFKDQEEAKRFLEGLDAGGDFAKLARELGEAGKAQAGGEEEYVQMKDLLPEVAQAVFNMKPGSVSKLFQSGANFLVFRMKESRFREDEGVREEARQIVLGRARKEEARNYSELLKKKQATVDEELLESLDFEKETQGFLWFREEKPVDFDSFLLDERVLATVDGNPPVTVTVADLARELKEKFFHGVERAAEERKINKRKDVVFENMLFKLTGRAEAREQGLHETAEYRAKVKAFTDSVLFGAFIDKVIGPEVKIGEEEVRSYYEGHLEEYSTPEMVRMRSLAFYKREDARSALERLVNKADFKWVSANADGLVDRERDRVLDLDATLLSMTALPSGLRETVDNAGRGEVRLYEDPKSHFHYVLLVDEVFPSRPKPYEEVRAEIARMVFNRKLKILVEEWTERLKEAYETKVFLRD